MNVPQNDLDDFAVRTLTLRTLVQRSTRQHGRPQFDSLQHADLLFATLLTRLFPPVPLTLIRGAAQRRQMFPCTCWIRPRTAVMR